MSASVAAPQHPPTEGVPVSLVAPPRLLAAVTAELADFLDDHAGLLLDVHPDLTLLADLARITVLGGGKRLRPIFVYWGWRAAQPAGRDGEDALIRAAASLELLQACALVHDDVMDSSATRRGGPAAHIRFADVHRARQWAGAVDAAEAFGRSGAILLGDLLLSWAEEMFSAAINELEPARAAAAARHFDLMRTEVAAGQFLDLLAQTRGELDVDEALRVIQFKTSKYTIERPLLIGAAAADADADVLRVLSHYGRQLGEAFQLRDDLLGVFGDPSETGKPAGDDLRGGKRTLLVALAAQRATTRQRAVIERGLGDHDLDSAGVAGLRQVLTDTGARSAVERRITECAERAAAALGDAAVQAPARQALLELAHVAAHRTR